MDNNFNLNNTLKELADGNESALEELFNHFYPRLYSFSKAFIKLEDGIDDILQEVFLRIWQNRKKIKDTYSFKSFLFTITRNLLLNELRRRLNNQKIKNEIFKRAIAEEYLILEKIEYDELTNKINQLVQELPPKTHKVFVMSRLDGFSHKEIASKLNLSEKTVEYHIRQAVKFLKESLKDSELLSLFFIFLFV